MASHSTVRYYYPALFASSLDNCTAAFRRALGVALQLGEICHQTLDAGEAVFVGADQRTLGSDIDLGNAGASYSRVAPWTPAQGRGDGRYGESDGGNGARSPPLVTVAPPKPSS